MRGLYWATTLALTIGAFAGTALVYDSLPEKIPTHWNVRGEVDGYSSRLVGSLLVPGMMVAILGVFAAMPWLSPKQFSVDSFKTTYLFIMTIAMMLMAYIHFLSLYAAFHPKIDVARAMIGGMGLMFAMMGNVMGRIKRNFYVGVRTPWTIASDRVWNDTHRIAAWSFVTAGMLMFLIAVTGLPMWLSVFPIFPAALGPVLYSLLHYKRLERQGKLDVSETTEVA